MDYSRTIEANGNMYYCNAPDEITDEQAVKMMEGGYIGETRPTGEVIDGVDVHERIEGTGWAWKIAPIELPKE